MSEFVGSLPECPDYIREIFGQYRSVRPHIVRGNNEEDYGVFPARAVLKRNGDMRFDVIYDVPTVAQLQRDFVNDELTSREVRNIYLHSGIIHAVLRNTLDPADMEHLETVYAALSTGDELCREILESSEEGDFEESSINGLLLSIREGWVVPDVAQINAARLSIALYGLLGTETDRQAIEKFKVASREQLATTLMRQDVYKSTMRAFGATEEECASQSANAIPLIEIVGSYPMGSNHAITLMDVIAKRH